MDQTIFHLINEQWTHPALDLFMAAISNIEIWRPFFIVIALALIIWGGFRGRAFVLCLIICLLITENVTSLLKNAIDRHRPKQVQSVRMVELQKATPEFLTLFKKTDIRYSDQTDRHRSGPSFPSGHMSNNTVIALCCTLFYRRRGWPYWFLTFAIGYSRIYLGAHWPSDILATLFLAAGETLLLLGALELLWRWSSRKWAPNFYEKHPGLIVDPTP
ncbi:MAG: phosphatase PAP2 family protein [Spartobacteria bacterium]